MEKNSMSPPRAIIFSHPRSGLHFLRCGLYLLEGGGDKKSIDKLYKEVLKK